MSSMYPQGARRGCNGLKAQTTHADRIAGKIAMIARRATKVVARTTMPRSATSRAHDFAATPTGTGFAGGLSRCARCEGDRPFASSHALHPIPQNRVCGHAGLNQRFLGLKL